MDERRRFSGRARQLKVALALAGLLGAGAQGVALQKPAPANATEVAEPDQAQLDMARGSFDRFLDQHPEVARDIRSDPQAARNSEFLRDHPELQAFLDAHPAVKADPRAFVSLNGWTPGKQSEMNNLLDYAAPFAVFLCILLGLLWATRTILENRRWNRALKTQEDLHARLLEKFGSGQELISYVESNAGRKLLEWAPVPIDSSWRGLPAAAGRVLWSLQAGIVLFLVGTALLVVRGGITGRDAVQTLWLLGWLGLALGCGFVISAGISYGLLKKIGLMEVRPAGETKLGPAQ